MRNINKKVSSHIKGKRELVVITKKEYGIRSVNRNVKSIVNEDISNLTKLLRDENLEMVPLFFDNDDQEERLLGNIEPDSKNNMQGLANYFFIKAEDERLDDVVKLLDDQPEVETAYIKPPAGLPISPLRINSNEKEISPSILSEQLSANEPHFIDRQSYLNPAPEGVDAFYAWKIIGGMGKGVRIIDLEWGWNFNHEDLKENQGGLVDGINYSDDDHHGTAVLGEISGDTNSFGITGIAPEANISAVSFSEGWETEFTAKKIMTAANKLVAGDIMLLEIHRPGPRYNFQERWDQKGYIGIEWWPDDLKAIQYAVSKGIIVVEPAGNGEQNLDDNIYDLNPKPPYGPFPSWWQNPFRRNLIDSGAILVGAGAPPPGTHGRNHGPDRSRLNFSNFGSALDVQGWGEEVTTTGGKPDGYDLFRGDGVNQWYTDYFSGTSSASPIVVGVIACIQGIVRAKNKNPFSPLKIREILRNTGSPQQGSSDMPATQRIGNRPDLKQIITTYLN
jgi:subtilisin family serine protease